MAHSELGIETLLDYGVRDVVDRLDAIADEIERILLEGVTPQESTALAVNRARRALMATLRNPAFHDTVELLHGRGTGVYDLIIQRSFERARQRIDGELSSVAAVRLDAQTIQRALRTQPTPFTFTVTFPPSTEIDPDTGKPVTTPGGTVTKKGTLKGYAGPTVSPGERDALVTFSELIAGGPERDLRLGLLRAECDLGAGRPEAALEHYFSLLRSETIEGDRRRYVAIRAATLRCVLGDRLYRGATAPSADLRSTIGHEYDEASALLAENGVSPDNPARAEIDAHVAKQHSQLARGLNYVGLSPTFVPVQRFTHLQAAAGTAIDTAEQLGRDVLAFLEKAEDIVGQTLDLAAQQRQEEAIGRIRAVQLANATRGEQVADEQIRLIEGQAEFVAPQAAVGAVGALLQGGVLGPLSAVPGIVGAAVNAEAQANELEHKRRIAQIEKDIARGTTDIAALEQQASDSRLRFLEERLEFLENKRVDADLFHRLAQITEQRAERHLQHATFLAYLFERALAFFLGDPGIHHIQLDYTDRHPGDILSAAGELRDHFGAAADELNKPDLDKADSFEEVVSLRRTFPLQFSAFQQTGTMQFDYSLYELAKSRPAAHQCRLREVGVELSPPPAIGFSGNLTHSGRFLVRDKPGTESPSTTRFVPTTEELEQALRDQLETGGTAAAVGGVLCYNLGPDMKELGPNTQFVSPAPEQFTLDIFEGYSPTGTWTLHIPNHGSLGVKDVLLHFAVVSRESDEGLKLRVLELLRAYESELAAGDLLDRIAGFSMLQEFDDDFFDLEAGLAEVRLEPDHFPQGLSNLQAKAVVVQALDADGRGLAGVGIEIARPDAGFRRQRVTTDGGFTEDLTGPLEVLAIDQRFPLVGAWQVRLDEPQQFSQLGDVRLFFMYAYEENPA